VLKPIKTAADERQEALDELARDMIEASRTLELLASRAAEQLESTFFEYARQIRERAEAQLSATERADLKLDS
jgi:hypothetical protein